MTTLTLEDNTKLEKTNFVNILDLYDYITENQVVTEFGELSNNEVNSEMLKDLDNAKKISRSDFVNI